jgi:hypothetical protein
MKKLPSPDKLIASLAKRSPREKAVLAVAALALSAAFVDRVIVATVQARLRELDTRTAQREAQIRKDLRIIAQKQRIEIQHVNYKPYLGMQSTENEEFTVFLKEVDTLARDNVVSVVDMKPTGTKEMESAKKYMINLNIEADMAALVKFMYAIEDSKKLMTVEKYQISPKSRDSDTAKCSLLISKLVIP